jgi:CSLREA domain-containing protein
MNGNNGRMRNTESVPSRWMRTKHPSIWGRLIAGGRIVSEKAVRPVLFAALFALLAGCGGGDSLYTVNSTGDGGDDNPGDGNCRTSLVAGHCTLRAAIEEANASEGSRIIQFNLPAGDLTIRPRVALPVITGQLVINGTTQPGYAGDPIVIVDGSDLATPLTSGMNTAAGSDVTFRGLQIVHFSMHGIKGEGSMRIENTFSGYNTHDGLESISYTDAIAVTVSDSEFSENNASGIGVSNTILTMNNTSANGNGGGGLWAANSDLTISGGSLNDNAAWNGGGMNLTETVHASLYNVDILNNRSVSTGGGIYMRDGGGSELSFWHCTISGNAGAQGGGLYQEGGYVNMDPGNTVTDNRADSGGGGIYLNGGELEVGRSTIGEAGHGNDADADDNTVWPPGGGIYNNGGDIYIFSSSIDSNSGSGIYTAGGSVRLYNTHVESNSRQGIQSLAETGRADLQIESSWISFNGMSGIEAEKTDLTVVGSSLNENHANGIFASEGQVTVSDSTMADNNHSGLYLENSDGAEIKRSAFWGNGRTPTDRGGGILIWIFNSTVVRMENVTIHGNRATVSGGGLDVAHGAASLNNVTVTQNVAPDGAGIHSSGALNVGNSILAENTGGNCSGAITSLGYNIDNSASCPLLAVGDQPNTAISLGPMHDNGGPTFTRAIFADGPAFDAGNDATCAAVDQRGVARPQAMHCDVGAFELEPLGTPESTPTPAAPTTGPGPTPTSTSILFDPVEFSADRLFQGGKTCSPMTLTVTVQVAPQDLVHSVALYYRLVEKDGTGSYPWTEGEKMERLGNGRYRLELSGNDLPSIYSWKHEAWLDIQFVAYDSNYQPVGRSAVIRQITLERCFN